MNEYYLAIDIGASSGRHILGWIQDGKIQSEEVYRFENGMKRMGESLCWDVDLLLEEVLNGMKKCGETGKIPKYMGIDTWAVDYVLLDKDGNKLGNTYGYRDRRTVGVREKVYEIISKEELYTRTGIANNEFNTIFQLMAHKWQESEILEKAEHLLMVPDYLCYKLTGIMETEYTNASTTGLVDANAKNWDFEIIEKLGLPKKIFKEIKMPGKKLGDLKSDIAKKAGFNVNVMTVASHDTASAVLSVPYDGKGVYISSGTWSLMGVETDKPDCSVQAMKKGFTNEGGFGGKYRYLKNIMGLWMIQSVRNEWGRKYSFAEICEMAKAEKDYEAFVDVNDKSFLAPESMTEAVKSYCKSHGETVPENEGQIAKVIYESLAKSYSQTVEELKENLGMDIDKIYIVGGGCNATYLNELTAKYTKTQVSAGPSEATAIGNIMAQILGSKMKMDVNEARKMICY